MDTLNYKAESERTDADERGLIPPFTHNKAPRQEQTEPLTLEQRLQNVQKTLINEVNHHIKCQKDLSAMTAHADKLAEALRDLTEVNEKYVPISKARIKAREALAAYEAAQ